MILSSRGYHFSGAGQRKRRHRLSGATAQFPALDVKSVVAERQNHARPPEAIHSAVVTES